MSKATPEMRRLAERLIAWETRGSISRGVNSMAAALVCEKLRPILGTLMGDGGFRGLLSRALALAIVETPWLQRLRVSQEGHLEGFDELAGGIQARKLAEGNIELVGQLLGLLDAFIGEDLTVRFVREAWPKLTINGGNSDSGGKK